jgi:hypothetical protein
MGGTLALFSIITKNLIASRWTFQMVVPTTYIQTIWGILNCFLYDYLKEIHIFISQMFSIEPWQFLSSWVLTIFQGWVSYKFLIKWTSPTFSFFFVVVY